MIHLPALPGAPRNTLAVDELIQFALVELKKLENAGLDAVILENAGDTPFFKEHVPPVTVAAMANISRDVVAQSKIAVGLNLLRNACAEALSVAHVTEARFIRCNIMIGAYATDQGIIEGCASTLLRLRRELGSMTFLFGDVHELIIGEPDFKVDGVWGGPNDERAYARAVQLCRG